MALSKIIGLILFLLGLWLLAGPLFLTTTGLGVSFLGVAFTAATWIPGLILVIIGILLLRR